VLALSTFASVSLVLLYVVLLLAVGIATLREGHWVMFILGFFFPLFWIIGALMGPTEAEEERNTVGRHG
jgi:hypothetical protein